MDWLAIEDPPDIDAVPGATPGSSMRHHWRSAWVRHIIRAHLLLDANASADSAIDFFMKVRYARDELLQTSVPSNTLANTRQMSLRPPLVELGKALASGRFPNTHTSKYDFIVDFHLRYLGREADRDSRDYAQARMHLQHPTKPCFENILQYLREKFGGKTAEEARRLLPIRERAIRTIRIALRDAQRLAKSAGNTETEAWLRQMHNTLFGSPSSRHPPSRSTIMRSVLDPAQQRSVERPQTR